MYVFHKVTHFKTSGGKKNWQKENPLVLGGNKPIYIVKQEQRDNKNRFSPFKLELRKGVDISYSDIKKAGSTQLHHQDERAKNATSTVIKPKDCKRRKKKDDGNPIVI